MTNLRDWSTEELMVRFQNRPGYLEEKRLVCPACCISSFQRGPQGGLSRNFRCENGHEWNVSAFGMDYIGNKPKPT